MPALLLRHATQRSRFGAHVTAPFRESDASTPRCCRWLCRSIHLLRRGEDVRTAGAAGQGRRRVDPARQASSIAPSRGKCPRLLLISEHSRQSHAPRHPVPSSIHPIISCGPSRELLYHPPPPPLRCPSRQRRSDSAHDHAGRPPVCVGHIAVVGGPIRSNPSADCWRVGSLIVAAENETRTHRRPYAATETEARGPLRAPAGRRAETFALGVL
jgi:hypothetical protein